MTLVSSTHGWVTGTGPSALSIPQDVAVDNWIICVLFQDGSAASPPVITSTGWTVISEAFAMNGSRPFVIFAKKRTVDDVQISVDNGDKYGWMLLWGESTEPISAWQTSGVRPRQNDGSSPRNWAIAKSVNVATDNSLAIALGFEATNALETPDTILGYDNDFVEIAYRNQGNVVNDRICTIWAGEKLVNSGPTGDTTILWRNNHDYNGAGIMFVIPGVITELKPLATLPNGDRLEITTFRDSAEDKIVDVYKIPENHRFYTVSDMDSDIENNRMVYWGHRGSSLDWSEMTLHGYTQARWRGVKALEVSCMETSDGVWITAHDENLLRATGQDLVVKNTLSSVCLGLPVIVPNPGGVIGRLEEVLEAFPEIVILADRKARGNYTNFLNLLKTVPDAREHIIVKFDGVYDVAFATIAKNEGFKTASYFWDTNLSNLDTAAPVSDYIGLNWNASQSVWNDVLAKGKPMWGHVCYDLNEATIAINKGAKIVQCASVKSIVPTLNSVH